MVDLPPLDKVHASAAQRLATLRLVGAQQSEGLLGVIVGKVFPANSMMKVVVLSTTTVREYMRPSDQPNTPWEILSEWSLADEFEGIEIRDDIIREAYQQFRRRIPRDQRKLLKPRFGGRSNGPDLQTKACGEDSFTFDLADPEYAAAVVKVLLEYATYRREHDPRSGGSGDDWY